MDGWSAQDISVPLIIEFDRESDELLRSFLCGTRVPLQCVAMGANKLRLADSDTSAGLTIDQAITAFGEWLLLSVRSGSHVRNALAELRAAAADQGWRVPSDITPESVQARLLSLTRKGNGPKTRNTKRGYLHRFGHFLVARGLISTNPVAAAPLARVVKKRTRLVPTDDQVRALVRAAKRAPRSGDRWLVYLAAATCGLRWGTLKALEWKHVRLDSSPACWDIPAELLKARRPAVVWITEELAEFLRRHRKASANRKPSTRIFRDGKDTREVRGFWVFEGVPKWEGFCRDLARAGLAKSKDEGGPTLSFNSLRHY
jgi:integrase